MSKSRKSTAHYFVRLTLPAGVSWTEGRAYIQEALECWCKGFQLPFAVPDDPGDPRWNIGDEVSVVKTGKGHHS